MLDELLDGLTRHWAAFTAGRAAYVPGTLPQPPYPLRSSERAAWLDGWETYYYDDPPEGPPTIDQEGDIDRPRGATC